MQARGTGQGFSQIIGYENIGIFLSNFPVQYNLHKLTISIRCGQILYKKARPSKIRYRIYAQFVITVQLTCSFITCQQDATTVMQQQQWLPIKAGTP